MKMTAIKWLLAGVAFLSGVLLWGWYFLAVLVFLAIVLFLLIWFWLAPADCFFTFVEEATAKAVMKGGAFDRIIFRWKKHFMDEEDNIWEEEDWEKPVKGVRARKPVKAEAKAKAKVEAGVEVETGVEAEEEISEKEVTEQKVKGHILGGLFWIGIWPVYGIHKYVLRWTDFRQTEEAGKEVFKLQFHKDEERKFVMLKPAVYGIELQGVETKPPERIPVDVQIPVTMRVSNPRKFLFVAPPTPLEDVLIRMSTLMRQRITMSFIDELMTLQGQADKIWEGIEETKDGLKVKESTGVKQEKLIKDTLPKWGIKVAKKGIEIKNIEPPPDIQKAMAEKRKQEMQAEARAEEVIGTLVVSEAVARGKTKKEIQQEINQDSARVTEFRNTSKEIILKKIAMENRSYTMIEPTGVSGIDASILSFIAAREKMPGGKGGGGEKEPKEEKTREETEDHWEEVRKEEMKKSEERAKGKRE